MELFFHWVRFTLVVWGLVYIVTQSVIFLPIRLVILKLSPRVLGALIFCPTCTGFWIGFGLGCLGCYGTPLAPRSIVELESALVAMILAHFWGMYWGDPYGYQKARYVVGLDVAEQA